jgi:hypothetical protein
LLWNLRNVMHSSIFHTCMRTLAFSAMCMCFRLLVHRVMCVHAITLPLPTLFVSLPIPWLLPCRKIRNLVMGHSWSVFLCRT